MTSSKLLALLFAFLLLSGPAFAERQLGGHKAIKSHFTEPGGLDTVHNPAALAGQPGKPKLPPKEPAENTAVQEASK